MQVRVLQCDSLKTPRITHHSPRAPYRANEGRPVRTRLEGTRRIRGMTWACGGVDRAAAMVDRMEVGVEAEIADISNRIHHRVK